MTIPSCREGHFVQGFPLCLLVSCEHQHQQLRQPVTKLHQRSGCWHRCQACQHSLTTRGSRNRALPRQKGGGAAPLRHFLALYVVCYLRVLSFHQQMSCYCCISAPADAFQPHNFPSRYPERPFAPPKKVDLRVPNPSARRVPLHSRPLRRTSRRHWAVCTERNLDLRRSRRWQLCCLPGVMTATLQPVGAPEVRGFPFHGTWAGNRFCREQGTCLRKQ
jgi:hypothetical protein